MVSKLSVFLTFVVLLGCALRAQALTQISNCLELQAMQNNLTETYELVNDIDCSDTINWNGGAGFEPVGWYMNNTNQFPFIGIFNGQGYIVSNVVINRPNATWVGVFGYTGNTSQIRAVGITGGSIVGYQGVGGLIGLNYGTLIESYTTNSVTAIDKFVGGLVGSNAGLEAVIASCYAEGHVSGGNAASFVSLQVDGAMIKNSYAVGMATGSGFLAFSTGGTVINSYWDTQTTGGTTGGGGGMGKTTAQMHQQSTFVGWNFTHVWQIEPNSYPQLRVFVTVSLLNPITDQSLFVGEALTFTLPADTFVERDGLSLRYMASFNDGPLPGWLRFNNETVAFSGTPQADDRDIYVIKVIACDGKDYCVSDLFSINVPNRIPVLQASFSDQQFDVGKQISWQVPSNVFVDPDNDLLSYTARLQDGGALPSWLLFDEATRILSGVSAELGLWQITIRVEDNEGGFASDTFTLSIVEPESPTPDPRKNKTGPLLSAGEKAAIIVPSVLCSLIGIAYALWKWKRKSEEFNSTRGDRQSGREMSTVTV